MALKKPDLNKPAFQLFPEKATMTQIGWCPTCGAIIKEENFRNDLSKKEYSISGMCQKCQDQVFGTLAPAVN